MKKILTILLLLSVHQSVFAQKKKPIDREPVKPEFLENQEVRIGVDLGAGGSIFHFSQVEPARNLLNHYDKGRFIQQSYYGDEDGSMWKDKPWRWNPIQGGGWRDEPAKVLEHQKEGNRLYVKSIGVNWATGIDAPDSIMEETITLEKDVAKIHFKFTYTGETTHKARHQELPAVFMDYDLIEMVFYGGTAPWTSQPITRKSPGPKNERAVATENWAAYVDANDWGMGVFFPGSKELTCYRVPANNTTGPKGAACSYFSPVQTFSISKGLVYEYDIYLKIGKTAEIREAFSKIQKTLPPVLAPVPAPKTEPK